MSGTFGTSMFGFKRGRVIDYIEQLNIDHNAEIADTNTKLSQTQEALKLSLAENERLNQSVSACEQRLVDLRELAEELKQRVDSNNQLHERIGDVFVEAKHSASRIIESATESAHTIVRSANNCATSTLDDIKATRDKLDVIRDELKGMLSEFDKNLDSISRSLESAKNNIRPAGFKINIDITEDDLIDGSVIQHK